MACSACFGAMIDIDIVSSSSEKGWCWAMTSISFDRAVEFYDATRGYPPGVDEQIADAIAAAVGATAETRFLEMGIGTGRIAFPLIKRGYHYTGIDLSAAMMGRLREKIDAFAATHPDQPVRVDLHIGDSTVLP